MQLMTFPPDRPIDQDQDINSTGQSRDRMVACNHSHKSARGVIGGPGSRPSLAPLPSGIFLTSPPGWLISSEGHAPAHLPAVPVQAGHTRRKLPPFHRKNHFHHSHWPPSAREVMAVRRGDTIRAGTAHDGLVWHRLTKCGGYPV